MTDMESCRQRQSQHDDDLRRQTERNAALLTTIDALAQEVRREPVLSQSGPHSKFVVGGGVP